MRSKRRRSAPGDGEVDVTAKYLNKQMHELPPELQNQLMGLEVTTDEERLTDAIKISSANVRRPGNADMNLSHPKLKIEYTNPKDDNCLLIRFRNREKRSPQSDLMSDGPDANLGIALEEGARRLPGTHLGVPDLNDMVEEVSVVKHKGDSLRLYSLAIVRDQDGQDMVEVEILGNCKGAREFYDKYFEYFRAIKAATCQKAKIPTPFELFRDWIADNGFFILGGYYGHFQYIEISYYLCAGVFHNGLRSVIVQCPELGADMRDVANGLNWEQGSAFVNQQPPNGEIINWGIFFHRPLADLESISVETSAEEIVAQYKEMIRDGEFRINSSLPSELNLPRSIHDVFKRMGRS